MTHKALSPQRNVRLLTWFNFFSDFRPYNPVAILYFAHVTGSFATGLAVFSVQSISASVFEIPTGVWSDMMGRRKTMISGAFFGLLSLIFYALGGSFVVLACGAVMAGLAESLFSGNNNALLYDSLAQDKKESRYGEISGKVNSMFQLALGNSVLLVFLILALVKQCINFDRHLF